MKIESASIVIEPRSVGACLDLGALFYREHAKEVLSLTLLFGLPAVLLSFWIASETDYGFFWSAVLLFILTPFLGGALVAGAGRRVFGEPFSVGTSVRAVGSDLLRLLFSVFVSRSALVLAGALCLGLPAIFPAVYYGFALEVLLLEQLRGNRARERLVELVKHTYFDLLGRLLVLFAFTLVVVVSVFVLVDQTAEHLFGLPVLFGRTSSTFWGQEMRDLLFYDPWVISIIGGIVWLVYPLARLGWFFCYLDTRIRKEGWDVELTFRVEARRLEDAI